MQWFSSMIGAVAVQSGKSGAEVGNAFKTIAARTLQIKSLAEELGESTEDLGNAGIALKNVGIEIQSGNGQLRSMQDILIDLAGK